LKGVMTGGVSYPYEQVMTGEALTVTKQYIAAYKEASRHEVHRHPPDT
jgi:hypothetical protein